MKNKNANKIEFIVEYVGLPVGEHIFEFDINNQFMQQYFEEPLENVFKVHSVVKLLKYNHSLQAKIQLKGVISVVCDKCLISYEYPIQYEADLLIEKGNPENSSDEILMVEENDNKINFSQYLYESVVMSLPPKIVPCEVFDNVECDEEILKKIQPDLSEQNKSYIFAELLKNKFKS
ncbi:MAG: hypothetical protein KatS3mg027_1752 [Bacteroidia bacterium]|nr:MAG: hypothetical protein KatS3mg027_1752 [Bacteroidia bacterium]